MKVQKLERGSGHVMRSLREQTYFRLPLLFPRKVTTVLPVDETGAAINSNALAGNVMRASFPVPTSTTHTAEIFILYLTLDKEELEFFIFMIVFNLRLVDSRYGTTATQIRCALD